MKIAFCTPFKPVDHPKISGDVTIGRDLLETLRGYGHEVMVVPHYPAKEIYLKPQWWLQAWIMRRRMAEQARGAECWLTYGTYYKVPDIYGPAVCRQLKMPYFIFQASYAENRGKKLVTWPGFKLNRLAMKQSDHIFCNRVNDLEGCAKLLPGDRYSYVKPGLPGKLFKRDEETGKRLRVQWAADEIPIVVTAAIMRQGVKEEGLRWVIDACSEIIARGTDLKLVVAGSGPRRREIEALARERLGEHAIFLGMVDRNELGAVYSAGDVFAFPGLRESVGMVYLEAQQCGLPVVATDDEGAPNVIAHERSGIITSADKDEFTKGIEKLVLHAEYRRKLGGQAVEYVQQEHAAETNYREVERIMQSIVSKARQ